MSEQTPASQPLRVGRKVSHTPFPTREELMKRNSFPGPDKNKYLNRMWGREEMTNNEYEKLSVESATGLEITNMLSGLGWSPDESA